MKHRQIASYLCIMPPLTTGSRRPDACAWEEKARIFRQLRSRTVTAAPPLDARL